MNPPEGEITQTLGPIRDFATGRRCPKGVTLIVGPAMVRYDEGEYVEAVKKSNIALAYYLSIFIMG